MEWSQRERAGCQAAYAENRVVATDHDRKIPVETCSFSGEVNRTYRHRGVDKNDADYGYTTLGSSDGTTRALTGRFSNTRESEMTSPNVVLACAVHWSIEVGRRRIDIVEDVLRLRLALDILVPVRHSC